MTTTATTTRSPRRSMVIVLAVLWSLIGLPAPGSWASDSENSRTSLKGLSGVQVVIEYLKPDAERAGLTTGQLQTDVEIRLRHAGIPVLTKEERHRVPGEAYLYVEVSTRQDSIGLFAYHIGIEVMQWVYIDHNASHVYVSTWHIRGIGTVGVLKLPTIREDVRDLVDRFINAYLSVNPRPAATAAPPASSGTTQTRQPRVESQQPPIRSYFDLSPPPSLTIPTASVPVETARQLQEKVSSPRRDLIRQVQERLQASGFSPGTIDGGLGPQTREALRWYQNSKGLRATGELDEKTLDALGVR